MGIRVGDEGGAEVDGAASRPQDLFHLDQDEQRSYGGAARAGAATSPRHARRGTALPASASWSTIARGVRGAWDDHAGGDRRHTRVGTPDRQDVTRAQRRYRYRHEPDRLISRGTWGGVGRNSAVEGAHRSCRPDGPARRTRLSDAACPLRKAVAASCPMGPNGAASAPHAMTGSSANGSETEFYAALSTLKGRPLQLRKGDALSG